MYKQPVYLGMQGCDMGKEGEGVKNGMWAPVGREGEQSQMEQGAECLLVFNRG